MTHEEKVKILVAEFNTIHGKVVLKKETSNLFRDLENTNQRLDVSKFTEVLSISDAGIADVEGMISMDELASKTLKKGYIPEVVIDLKTITAGGAVSGIAIEASSFKYGLFHETVEEMEVLTPTGDVVICTKDTNSDLFYALPNSYGTLGYILRLKIRLKKAKRFVKITHIKYSDAKKCFEDLEMFSKSGEQNFLDCVVFDKDNFVITLGEFVDEAPFTSDYKYMKIYYKSLLQKDEDYLNTYDYLFRWDPDWWWGSQNTVLKYKIVRLMLGKWTLDSKFYVWGKLLGQKYNIFNKIFLRVPDTEGIIQDIGIPRENWEKFLTFLLSEIKILPIWLCPFKGNSKYTLFPIQNEVYLDFGVWGNAPSKGENMQWNRLLEKKTYDMRGIKSLYSEVAYTKEEFWKNSNKKGYEKVKSKYDPNGRLKSLYEKVTNK